MAFSRCMYLHLRVTLQRSLVIYWEESGKVEDATTADASIAGFFSQATQVKY